MYGATHSKEETPHLDRWHYLDYRDGKHDQNYIEWKYFNFVQKDPVGYIVYYILDPEKKTKLGGGRVMVRILKDGKFYGAIHNINIDSIQFDTISATVTMGNTAISETTPYYYDVKGELDNIAWKLAYKQKVPTIVSFSNTNPGLMRWENVNWLIKMPKAHVEGTICMDNQEFNINSLGYTDTNWGEIMPFFSRYEWGQYNSDKESFVFGVLYGLKNIKSSYFYFVENGRLVSLEGAKCKVDHVRWTTDLATGLKMPSDNMFIFKSKNYTIELSSRLMSYDLLGIKISSFLPKSVVVEQIVEYRGTIKKDGVLTEEFQGLGFEEWSTRTWRKIPILF